MFRKIIVLIAVFNALMTLAFVFANISIWNFINTLSSQASYGDGVVMPIIQVNALQVTGYIDAWTNEGIAVPTMPPGVIPNYPFIIFWVALVGNLVLLALVLRKRSREKISGEN